MFRLRRLCFSRARGKRRGGAKCKRRMGAFEALESRALLSASPLSDLTAQPLISPMATNTAPSGYTPGRSACAYGFDQIAFTTSTGAVSGTGAGQTIAIVDAYNDPNIVNDLSEFDSEFDVAAPPKLAVVSENGSSRLPAANADWSLEISLDVEWAHAIAPAANILLVEANSASLSDLLTAINYARQQPGVAVVSMSWGGSEFNGETSYDGYFTTPTGHAPVSFVASSGDNGGDGLWPSVSPNVLSVGGTALSINSSSVRTAETAWSDSSGGASLYESEPAYQTGVQSTGRRTTPDVADDADPNTGLAIYDSVSFAGQSGWFTVGGTSAGSPQWAALTAIVNQGRALLGAAAQQDAPADLYALPKSDFYDVTSGQNNDYSATPGYDMVTGLGAPNANLIVQNLVYGLSAPTTTSAATKTTRTAALTAATTGHIPRVPPVPHGMTGPSRPSAAMEPPGSGLSNDSQQSAVSVVNGAASAAPETEASSFASPAAPSLGEAATSGLAPADVSVHRVSDAAWAADAHFAELCDPQLAVAGEVLPMVG